MRTDVEVLYDVDDGMLKKGDKGYIDGYIKGGDNTPYAAVVCLDKGIIVLCPLHSIKPLSLA